MKTRMVAGLCALVLLAAEARANGVIRGTIWASRGEARRAALARERIPPEPRRGFFSFLFGPPSTPGQTATPVSNGSAVAMPPPRRQPDIVDAIVTVRQIPDPVERRLAQQSARDRARTNPRIVINHSRYQPRVLPTAAGSSVEIQNLDRIWHSTFSVSPAQRFDLGKLRPGQIDTVHFSRTGVINLHCDIHPDEAGFVVVAPNHAFARPDSLGRFVLPKLPPGSYRIEVWHPLRGTREQAVEIPKRGDVTCDLAF